MDDILTKLKVAKEEDWPAIIKKHLLSCDIHELGPHPMDIYFMAYYAESGRKRSREDFIAFVKEHGTTDKDGAAAAIRQVGLKDGK